MKMPGAASGDDESCIVTPGDADGFHAVLSRAVRKKRQAKPTPGGVISVLPPMVEPSAALNLDMIDPVALVARLLENDQLHATVDSLFQQLVATVFNVASGRGIIVSGGLTSQGKSLWAGRTGFFLLLARSYSGKER